MGIEEARNFSEIVRYQARHNAGRLFIKEVRTGRCVTFQEFDGLVDRTANRFDGFGVRPGERVTACVENSVEYCAAYCAAIRIGAIFNPMPSTSHTEEIKKNIRYVNPALILLEEKRLDEFAGEEFPVVGVMHNQPEMFSTGARVAQRQPPVIGHEALVIDENAPACLYYSSGTTGNPKGVLISHKNMIANIPSICRGFHFDQEREVHLVFLPMGHTASINYQFLPCLYIGGTMILAESFWQIRLRFWELIEQERATYIESVPTVLYSILNMYRDTAGADVSSLRCIGCGSAPLQKTVQIEFQKRFGVAVPNLYGLSETGPTHYDDPLRPGWQPGSIGLPLDVNEAAVFDANDSPVGPDQVGEIVIKGDNVFVGYYDNDELYAQVMRGGYFHTGDLGYFDENGVFYYVDRIKDLIIKGGTNIAPGEIDEVLLSFPAVKEAVTIGVPDEMFGEDIKSFVVLRDGKQATVEDIAAHCRLFLPPLKAPKVIEIIASLPKTHSGKLLRRELRQQQAATVKS